MIRLLKKYTAFFFVFGTRRTTKKDDTADLAPTLRLRLSRGEGNPKYPYNKARVLDLVNHAIDKDLE